MKPTLSICIPSYNRPEQIGQLLKSIDCDPSTVEIVICEDCSPQREAIREVVKNFSATSPYKVEYHENTANLGFDGNLRRLVEAARGEYVLFMGDDDLFLPNAIDKYVQFIREHREFKYILRSHIVIHPNGDVERFRYLPATTVLPAGEETVAWLFKRCVTICGFTIARDEAHRVATSEVDGTLLYQVYLMSEVCLTERSVYCDLPIVQAIQSFRLDKPNFGAAATERSKYTPGMITPDNSINFTKSYFELTDYLDRKHGTTITPRVRMILSRFAYPFLSIQRKRGIPAFLHYAKRLEIECGFGCSPHYYAYKWGLVILGERVCDRIIVLIKNVVGYTPPLGPTPS